MKKLFLMLVLAVAACPVTLAQDTTSTHAKKKPGTAKAKGTSDMKKIDLTKDQQKKIKATNQDFKAKTQKVKGDSSLTAGQKKAKLKELSKEKKKDVDTVLTADQKNKLKQLHKEHKANSPQNTKPSPKTAGSTKR